MNESLNQMSNIFFEEANDLLDNLEDLLLELEEKPQDKEAISAVFRTMHTIKGSSAMFGFDVISQFTHEVETAFDAVRNGEVSVTPELITLTLRTRDHIRNLLDIDNAEAYKEESLAIIEEYKALMTQTSIENTFIITFEPAEDVFVNGTRPHALLAELQELGTAKITPFINDIPALENMNPTLCYTSWEIELKTTVDENTIKDVFIFLDSSSKITIKKKSEENKVTSEKKEQEKIETLKKATQQGSQTIKVNSEKLDKLIDLVGELVTFNARLGQQAMMIKNQGLSSLSEHGERLILELRDTAMDMRMLPIGTIFSRFRRLVRDLSSDMGKNIELITEGAETELDKTVIEKLNDPLVHLIRNSIDHGIETPEIRAREGKNETGHITLKAQHAGAFVVITIEDDGSGLDRRRIVNKAIEKGLIENDADLNDQEIWDLIFKPGFSTADKVTSISGRGVGMDVVKKDITALGGTVSASSKTGKGTKLTLKLPLTLAIIEGILVKLGKQHYVIPLANVVECLEFERNVEEKQRFCSSLNIRDEVIPYIDLRTFFDIKDESESGEQIVIVTDQDSKIGLIIDKVVGNYQTVIKPLGKLYQQVQGISGATILGDGAVGLILDIYKLSELIKDLDSNNK